MYVYDGFSFFYGFCGIINLELIYCDFQFVVFNLYVTVDHLVNNGLSNKR